MSKLVDEFEHIKSQLSRFRRKSTTSFLDSYINHDKIMNEFADWLGKVQVDKAEFLWEQTKEMAKHYNVPAALTFSIAMPAKINGKWKNKYFLMYPWDFFADVVGKNPSEFLLLTFYWKAGNLDKDTHPALYGGKSLVNNPGHVDDFLNEDFIKWSAWWDSPVIRLWFKEKITIPLKSKFSKRQKRKKDKGNSRS